MLLPMELETAISPSPCIATNTLVNKSGTLVPAAKNVKPMISSGIFHCLPMVTANQTITYERAPTIAIDIKKLYM